MGDKPPDTLMVTEPLLNPLQVAFVTGADVTTGAAEFAMLTDPVLEHPEISVMMTL